MTLPQPSDEGNNLELFGAIPPAIRERLTDNQANFVLEYVQSGGHDPELAATEAGYAPGTAKRIAYDLLRRPLIQECIRYVVLNLFASDAVSARHVLVEIMKDAATPATVRRQAAMNILHLARLDPGQTINVNKRNFQTFNLESLSESERKMFEKLFARVTGELFEGEGHAVEEGQVQEDSF